MRDRAPLLRSPDWEALTVLLDTACREQGLLTRSGTPNYGRLARLCGRRSISTPTTRPAPSSSHSEA